MSKKNNIITINGTDYDAYTGLPLHAKKSPAKPTEKPKPASTAKTKKPAATVNKAAAKPKSRAARKPAPSIKPHSTKSSKTLMRKAVKKPSDKPASSRSIKANGSIQVQPKLSHGSINTKLLSYAKKIHRSPLIEHFSSVASADMSALTETTTVKPAKKPPQRGKQKPKTTAELLEYAIQQSNSHEQLPPPKKSKNPLKRKS